MKTFLGASALTLALAAVAAGPAHAQSPSCGEAALDANADGVIDADERQAFEMGVYSGTDANLDGVVSRDEHCFPVPRLTVPAEPIIILNPAMRPDPAEEMRAQFDTFDRNDDGRVSSEEWAGNTSVFGAMDEDQDGHVTFEEYAGSQAAAYSAR